MPDLPLCFVVPVRHHANAADWGLLRRNLVQTAASIAGQTHRGWRAVVVANEGSDLPDLPAGFSVVRVDFPPNPSYAPASTDREAFLDAVRLDKGRRVLAGVLSAPDARHVMVVDDDDLVSNRLAGFIAAQDGATAWRVDEGYCWTPGSRLLFRHWDFSRLCGSSLLIPRAAFDLPASVAAADPADIKALFGSHVIVKDRLATRGIAWKGIPFPAAVYRMGYGGNHSGAGSILRTWVLNRKTVANPIRLARHLRRCSLYTQRTRAEFGLP